MTESDADLMRRALDEILRLRVRIAELEVTESDSASVARRSLVLLCEVMDERDRMRDALEAIHASVVVLPPIASVMGIESICRHALREVNGGDAGARRVTAEQSGNPWVMLPAIPDEEDQ